MSWTNESPAISGLQVMTRTGLVEGQTGHLVAGLAGELERVERIFARPTPVRRPRQVESCRVLSAGSLVHLQLRPGDGSEQLGEAGVDLVEHDLLPSGEQLLLGAEEVGLVLPQVLNKLLERNLLAELLHDLLHLRLDPVDLGMAHLVDLLGREGGGGVEPQTGCVELLSVRQTGGRYLLPAGLLVLSAQELGDLPESNLD